MLKTSEFSLSQPKRHWEFWVVLFVPWLLDILGGRSVLASVFGASLWGMGAVVALAHEQAREPRFRRRLGLLLSLVCACWLTYWVLCFTGPRPTYFGPRSLQWLTLFHAGLLAAGAGMVIVLCFSTLLWLFQDSLLKKTSWERRTFKGKVPSIESLSKVCQGTLGLAAKSWGAGLALAFVTALMRWKRANLETQKASLEWIFDARILMTSFLWLLLLGGIQVSKRMFSANPWLYRLYLLLSVFFLGSFAWFVSGNHPILHEPINWFVR